MYTMSISGTERQAKNSVTGEIPRRLFAFVRLFELNLLLLVGFARAPSSSFKRRRERSREGSGMVRALSAGILTVQLSVSSVS